MDARQTDEGTQGNRGGTEIKRRGLIAGAAALAAGLIAKLAMDSEPVQAATGGSVLLGQVNSASGTDITVIQNPTSTLLNRLTESRNFGVGMPSIPSTLAIGFTAVASSAGAPNAGTTFPVGVYGVSSGGHGAVFTTNAAYGVLGQVQNSNGASTVGVYGLNASSGGSGMAVRGTIAEGSTAANTIAVYGENFSADTGGAPGAGGFGVYGFSSKGHGLVGATNAAGGSAVVGATNGVAGAYAGVFFGPFVVTGAKSAAVPNCDGTHSLLYCVESPESWFEDFGRGTLTAGRAEVVIDPAFAGVVDLCDYHVFLTAHGDFQLHVAAHDADRFTVQQTTGAGTPASDGTFSWRLVAKRKDIQAPRLARITLPREPQRPDPAAPIADVTPGPSTTLGRHDHNLS